jgi:acetyltransferase-like isoleucine patch superfamily enzyme
MSEIYCEVFFSVSFFELRQFIAMLKMLLEWRRARRVRKQFHKVGLGFECDPTVKTVFAERIDIGDYVYIGPGTYLHGRGGLHVHDHCIIGPEVIVLTSMHNYKNALMVPYDDVELLRPVTIGQCVWIGIRAIIIPGVHIGEGSIIGAGAVVTKSFPPGSIIAGNPAKVVGQRDMSHYRQIIENKKFYLLFKRQFNLQKREVLVSF